MKLETRYACHPDDAKRYDTAEQRRHFLFERPFEPGELSLVYSHVDRAVAGGAMPLGKPLELEGGKEFGSAYFLERRELGAINIGGPGRLVADGQTFEAVKGDGFYIGRGTQRVAFESLDPANPAKFWLMSTPAHAKHPTVKIEFSKANPRRLGEIAQSNQRTIYQYVHPAVCASCQLVMGMTVLEPGSVWNTMPPHTHERRMEVYFYFDMDEGTRVFHLHGQADETRHLVLSNEQAVISPSWSIHSGVATGRYTFIWGMAGENQTFDDMDGIGPDKLR